MQVFGVEMPHLPAAHCKNMFRFGKAWFFKCNCVRQSVKHVNKYLQQALHTGANNYLFRRTDNAARLVAVTRKCAAQVGLALRVAVTGE